MAAARELRRRHAGDERYRWAVYEPIHTKIDSASAGIVGEDSRGSGHSQSKLGAIVVIGYGNFHRICPGATDRTDARQHPRSGDLSLAHAAQNVDDLRVAAGIIVAQSGIDGAIALIIRFQHLLRCLKNGFSLSK
jgi:hypothetical protein